MKRVLSLSLMAAACMASVPQASATQLKIADGTYTFTETDGQNYGVTGSTVTFVNDQLTSWDIIIDSPGAPHYDVDTYTPLNSSISTHFYQGGVYGIDQFGYNIEANVFDANNNPHVGIGWGGGVGSGYIYDNPSGSLGPLDPSGNWSLDPVPDGGMTAGLLGGALIGLAALRRNLFA